MPSKSNEITDLDEAVKRVDYRQWFTDVMAKDYIANLVKLYKNAKTENEKKALLEETALCIQNYSLMVYYIYEYYPNFKKAIDSNPELKKNFNMIKKWLDEQGGRKVADEYVKEVVASVKVGKR